MNDIQRAAVNDRSKWMDMQRDAFKAAAAALAEIAVVDFEHQMGPRGLWSWETGQREAEENVDNYVAQLAKDAKDKLMNHIFDTRISKR